MNIVKLICCIILSHAIFAILQQILAAVSVPGYCKGNFHIQSSVSSPSSFHTASQQSYLTYSPDDINTLISQQKHANLIIQELQQRLKSLENRAEFRTGNSTIQINQQQDQLNRQSIQLSDLETITADLQQQINEKQRLSPNNYTYKNDNQNQIAALQTHINNLASLMNNSTNINNHTTLINQQQDQLKRQSTQISDLQSAITNLSLIINEKQNSLLNISTQINDNQSQIVAISTEVKNIASWINNDSTNISSNIAKLSQTVSKFESSLVSVAQSVPTTTLYDTIFLNGWQCPFHHPQPQQIICSDLSKELTITTTSIVTLTIMGQILDVDNSIYISFAVNGVPIAKSYENNQIKNVFQFAYYSTLRGHQMPINFTQKIKLEPSDQPYKISLIAKSNFNSGSMMTLNGAGIQIEVQTIPKRVQI